MKFTIRQLINTPLALGLMFLLSSCGAQTETQVNETDKVLSYGAVTTDGYMAMAQGYFLLKDALVASNVEEAKIGAIKIVKALSGMEIDDVISAIREDAEHIEGTNELSHQRDHFNSLSDNIYEVLSREDSQVSTVYKQHCPMAREGNGANWLSLSSEIRNPYFGDKMLKCGSVTESLK
ncbi:MAG: hypothetical protein ACI959_000513 [Limisphaerales bacterium]|jgi:hypothetical protein